MTDEKVSMERVKEIVDLFDIDDVLDHIIRNSPLCDREIDNEFCFNEGGGFDLLDYFVVAFVHGDNVEDNLAVEDMGYKYLIDAEVSYMEVRESFYQRLRDGEFTSIEVSLLADRERVNWSKETMVYIVLNGLENGIYNFIHDDDIESELIECYYKEIDDIKEVLE